MLLFLKLVKLMLQRSDAATSWMRPTICDYLSDYFIDMHKKTINTGFLALNSVSRVQIRLFMSMSRDATHQIPADWLHVLAFHFSHGIHLHFCSYLCYCLSQCASFFAWYKFSKDGYSWDKAGDDPR
jgi:hypothetical protein